MPKQRTVSKDTPFSEITLRKYEKPYQLEDRELIRKLCLSIGLLQPGDSRDIIVDIFHVIHSQGKDLTAAEIENLVIESRKKSDLPLVGIAGSNIRRQLKRLRDIFLLEKNGSSYRITENMQYPEIFDEKIEKFYLNSIKDRVREYFNVLEDKRKK
ncbi:MAG: hypothetical protein ABII01_06100 [Candidatus Woesearchaeota archaeon]